jgi:ATPase subunit of ABC transporter with duplicated ATPase domains
MPASLHARQLSLAVGSRLLLSDVDVVVHPGKRVGLVGPNGVGKSTLLRLLAGRLAPDSGSVHVAPATATVGYLDQEPERTGESVGVFVARRTGVTAAQAEFDAAGEALSTATADSGASERYDLALTRWLAAGVADFDARLGTVWAEIGLAARLVDQPMDTLSGGEAARVGLAALLLTRFDVLLLDEPTNDLDLDGLEVLERFVVTDDRAMVLVSHDREFLRRTVTDVAELDEFSHRLSWYAGGYDAYLHEREVARQQAWAAWEQYDAKRAGLAGRAQREREWATQGLSKAKKRPDDGDKHIRSFKINQTEQLAGKAARTEKAMQRLDVVEQPREPWQLRMTIAAAPRSGTVVAELVDAVVDRGEFRLGPVSVAVDYGERVVIVGANGSGKSTLLGALLGEIGLTAGARRTGSSLRVGRLEQLRAQLGQDRTVLDAFQRVTAMQAAEARTLLAKFGIGAGHVVRPTASMSPGERTRLVMATFMASGRNCLVLDEPTNHLDLPAIEQLEQALESFDGTLLLVTHDRALLGAVRRTRTITMEAGRVVADQSV